MGNIGKKVTIRITVEIMILTILFLEVSAGAVPAEESNKTFIETGSEVLSVQQTSDGGNILIGRTIAGGTSIGECKNGLCSDSLIQYYDVWLKKTDAYGQLVWKKILFQKSTSSFPNSVQQTSDGGYLLQWKDETKIWLTKTDSDGNQNWFKIILNGSENNVSIEPTKTPSSNLIEIPKAESTHTPIVISNETEMASPKEKASGFEIVLAITILSLAIIIKRIMKQ